MNDFKNKTVIITGGSRGIGRACCIAFGKQGANIVFTYHNNEKEANSLSKLLKKSKIPHLCIRCDVREITQCRNVVEQTISKFKNIDILINNAGITKDKALLMMTPEDWKDVLDTNLNGVFNMTRACITTFLKQKYGCIINMSSVSGITGLSRQTNYSASKAGIIGFSKALAKEVASYNIRVNVVCPGYIQTDMINNIPDNFKQNIISSIPMGRLGQPEEVAELCIFLASPKSNYITGEIIKIDGGLAI